MKIFWPKGAVLVGLSVRQSVSRLVVHSQAVFEDQSASPGGPFIMLRSYSQMYHQHKELRDQH